MNNILNHFLEDHIEAYELKCDTASAFEHFFNYLTVRNYTSRHFDPADVSLGKGEVGIDVVAIIVNDTLVTFFFQIEEFFNNNMDISVSLIFVQPKTSESFESSDLSQFFAAVNDFFMNSGRIFMNEKAEELRKIYQYIVDNPTKLAKNPDCYLFYSFTGTSVEDSVRNH